MSNLNEVQQWFRTSQPGDRMVYHVGALAGDRKRKNEQAKSLSMAARYLLLAERDGEVTLVQRRLDERQHEYIAVRRDKQPEAW